MPRNYVKLKMSKEPGPCRYYTCRGDEGETYLGDKPILKDTKVIHVLGDVDELSAFLGHVHSLLTKEERLTSLFQEVEYDLYVISTTISGYSNLIKKKSSSEEAFDLSKRIKFLEKAIESYSQNLKYKPKFVYPNGSRASTMINIARTVSRRAERSVVSMGITDKSILSYLNRLSSLLYVLFRYQNAADGITEEFFGPRD